MVGILLWTIIFLCIAAQGFFLGIQLLFNSEKKSAPNSFLGSFIFVFSIILLCWVGYWNDLPASYPVIDNIFYPIPFLLGPLLWMYFRGFILPMSKKQSIHLIPFLLTLILSLIIFLFPQRSASIKDLTTALIYALHSFSFLCYSFSIMRLIRLNKDLYYQKLETTFIKQLSAINLFFAVFAILAAVNFLLNRIFYLPVFIDLFLGLIISIFIYLIGYIGLGPSNIWKKEEKDVKQKYVRSGLTQKAAPGLIQDLIQYLEDHQPYLDNNYKLDKLASDTRIPSHYISELFNKYLEKSFSEVINHYRVEEAKKLLLSNDWSHIKPSAIGDEVGFNSNSTFYFWFKKITGIPPASYRKRNKKI